MNTRPEPNPPAGDDPLVLLRHLPDSQRVLLLHSGRHHPRWATHSLLARPAATFRVMARRIGVSRSEWIVEPGGGRVPAPPPFTHKPLVDLRAVLDHPELHHGTWVGHIAYDIGRWIERLPDHALDDRDWPLIELAWCPTVHRFDLSRGTWHPPIPPPPPPPTPPSTAEAHGLQSVGPAPHPRSAPAYTATHLSSTFTRAAYEQAVRRVREYIAAGDVFQVNLAQRFTCEIAGDQPHAARELFARLASVSPAWYGAYLELCPAADGTRRVVASTSPELFLELDADGQVATRPIKGTRPASAPASELLHSAKDTAELNMIVDLLRNDLGRVCDYGSVRVAEPRTIETHPTVHHGVATITGRLHPSRGVVDLLRATMPGGSITGAPKVRAMQIIDELEPVRRGPYCGAIGWLRHDSACLNIAIRTMLVESPAAGAGRVDFSVGGGIVADSDPAHEYDETLHKAAAMLQALGLTL